ncbi:cytochrome-c oxidase, cbb3-type subunit III [Octadecabacter sp. CECT 8868]|uniref:cytochrome-c oxidase, cbb3-type subunit III n=1 Tax=Octadecabacter algicola TaxID=2909342 RepID=UPI001F2F8786|nr:cytochrome-c oxidase, cbb3-type subunit III [Octadecabacter algicola]MCF2905862.1 cytochrome-c oxidase, cbb3-type subunit III [Octadecabacter algicola]
MSNNDKQDDVGTTGHSWDGIEELNNPLPRWWVWILYLTIVWAIGYTIAYPAWPLVTGATEGVLGFSTRGEVQEDILRVEAENADLLERLTTVDLAAVSDDDELHGFAINAGSSIFAANCSQCHGRGAAGVQAGGYPNLLDDDWLWGGSIDEIVYTVTHGIRNEQSFDSRYSEMPKFGADEILIDDEITALVQHVRAISGQEHDAELATVGAELFLDNCASCHGDAGEGMAELGAPNLSDAIWLYGGDEETIYSSIYNARFGVMPAWSEEYRAAGGLSAAEINAVAVYVHQLGGAQ